MKTTQRYFFLYSLLILLMVSPTALFAQDPFVVVLDAGHGGKDPGNMGNGYKEKGIALNIVLEVGKALEKHKDIKVVYTRKTDVFLELHERANIANKADANLFVSVHCNAHSSNAHGTETFVLGLHRSDENFEVAKKENQVIYLEDDYEERYAGFDPNSPESLIGLTLMQEEYLGQSIELASFVQNNFTAQLKRNNRSVKQAGFWVLYNTYMPSVLIETGFLTNKNEGAYLNSRKGQREMADAITKAILKYHDELPVYDTHIETRSSSEIIEENMQHHDTDIYEGVIFKVQLAASSNDLALEPYNFKGLDEISKEKEGNLYRYFYGNTSDYNVIQLKKKLAKQKGYTQAFIVAYKNGQKQKLTDVLKQKK